MKKMTILPLLVFICIIGTLKAQEYSRLELINSYTVVNNSYCYTTWSDSLLHMYSYYYENNTDYTNTTYYLKHWTVSPSGIQTEPEILYSYQADYQTLSTTAAIKGASRYYFIFSERLEYPNESPRRYHIIAINEINSVQHCTFEASGIAYSFCSFTNDYLIFWDRLPNPINIAFLYCYDANTNLINCIYDVSYFPPSLSNLDNRYLLVGENPYSQATLIDPLLIAHSCNQNITTNLSYIYLNPSEILPNTYLGVVSGNPDGKSTISSYGFLTINDLDFEYVPIGYEIYYEEIGEGYEGLYFGDIVPYGNGRFSCISINMNSSSNNYNYFKNYVFNGSEVIQDNEFPNLSAYTNPVSLQKTNDRYSIAAAGTNQYILIDNYNQSIADTTFMVNGQSVSSGRLIQASDCLYYKDPTSMRMFVMKIIDSSNNPCLTLSSFVALITGLNNVRLEWVTQSENHMQGYRIYRNTADSLASAQILTTELIPATNTSTEQTYSYSDNELEADTTYYYWLECLDNVTSEFHGPVSVQIQEYTISSFSAIETVYHKAELEWVTPSENQMQGFRIYRSISDSLSSAEILTQDIIPATNTSEQQTYTFTDNNVESGNTYYYWLECLDYVTSEFYGPVSVHIDEPEVNELQAAYPNPFSLSTTIPYKLKDAGRVDISIFNVKGQKVWSKSLYHPAPGYYETSWNGRDNTGRFAAAGLYYCRMKSNDKISTRKILLMK